MFVRRLPSSRGPASIPCPGGPPATVVASSSRRRCVGVDGGGPSEAEGATVAGLSTALSELDFGFMTKNSKIGHFRLMRVIIT